MKKPSKLSVAVFLSIVSVTGFAQSKDTRQKLYTAQPQNINIDKNSFTNMLQTSVGSHISLPISTGFTFEGTVISNFTKYGKLQTIIIQSSENKASIFQITKILEENNTSYTGRIINNNAADGYEIKNNNGQYFLQKFETQKILDPCKL